MSAPPLEPVLAQAAVPFLALDAAGRLLGLNPAAERLLGRPAAELLGAPLADLVDAFSREKAALMLAQTLAEGAASDWELNHPRPGAPPALVTYHAWSYRTAPGAPPLVAAVGLPADAAVDLAAQLAVANQQLEGALLQLERAHAELKHAQAQLVRSEKLRALGQLVAGVAHEINTPLGFVANNLAFLAEQLPALAPALDDAARQDIDDAVAESQDGIARIAAIVRALRGFARPDSPGRQSADLNAGLAATVRIARAAAQPNVTIVERYGDLPPVVCNPGEINQVLLNLLSNAAQAIDGPGTIVVETALAGDSVTIVVRDSGAGMDEQTLARIGEPFFTTRPVGSGTGLGIAISQGIARSHGGALTFASAPGQGTTATLTLPVAGA
jgi:two-component system NtrC family sensor kinase